jgi:hypothetical protein
VENEKGTDEFIGIPAYMAEKAKERGMVDKVPIMPKGVDEEDAIRLAIKAPYAQKPLPPRVAQPRYAAAQMPPWRPQLHRPLQRNSRRRII